MAIWTALCGRRRYVWCDNLEHTGDAHLEQSTCLDPELPAGIEPCS